MKDIVAFGVDRIRIVSSVENGYGFLENDSEPDNATVLGLKLILQNRQGELVVFLAVKGLQSEKYVRETIIEPWLKGDGLLKAFTECICRTGNSTSPTEHTLILNGSVLIGGALGPTSIVGIHSLGLYTVVPKTHTPN